MKRQACHDALPIARLAENAGDDTPIGPRDQKTTLPVQSSFAQRFTRGVYFLLTRFLFLPAHRFGSAEAERD